MTKSGAYCPPCVPSLVFTNLQEFVCESRYIAKKSSYFGQIVNYWMYPNLSVLLKRYRARWLEFGAKHMSDVLSEWDNWKWKYLEQIALIF